MHGPPTPLMDVGAERNDLKVYLNGDVLAAYYASDPTQRSGMTPVQWRDPVIAARIEIIDQYFFAFKAALNAQTTTLDLGVDLLSLGLAGAASVAGTGTAQALAAANTGVIGTGTAFNKEALYQKTLPAIFAQMEADRTTVLVRIRSSQALADPTKYPLSTALTDLSAYERAGTLEGAVQSLTAAATDTANTNKQTIAQLTGLTVLPADVQSRKVKFTQYIAQLVNSNKKATLDLIVSALNSAFNLNVASDATAKTEAANILIAVDPFVNGAGAATAMSSLSDKLKSITNQTF
jgi:hypothetical protein